MPYGIKVSFDSLRETAFGSVTGSYVALGGEIADNARIICFTNTTNEDIYVSDDAVNNQLRVPAQSFKLFDFTTNRVTDDGYFLPAHTTFYIKHAGVAPTSGNVWLEVVQANGGI